MNSLTLSPLFLACLIPGLNIYASDARDQPANKTPTSMPSVQQSSEEDFLPTTAESFASLHARPTLVLEHQTLIPDTTTALGISFEMDPEWHVYWKGQNDAGLPISVQLILPEGLEADEVLWPAPTREVLPGDIITYIYYSRVTLIVPIKVTQTFKPLKPDSAQNATIRAKLNWLVCKEACVAEQANLELKVPFQAPTANKDLSQAEFLQINETAQPWFAVTRKRLPIKWTEDQTAIQTRIDGSRIQLRVPDASHLLFMPEESGAVVQDPISSCISETDTLILNITPNPEQTHLKGILEVRVNTEQSPKWYEINLNLSQNPP